MRLHLLLHSHVSLHLGFVQLLCLHRLNHRHHIARVLLHRRDLLSGSRRLLPIVAHKIGRDLVVNKQLQQLLRQLDLLGERAIRQREKLLELRLELDQADREDALLQLHLAERAREALLLRREALDRVTERLGCRERVEEERQHELVLIGQDDRLLRLETIRGTDLAEQQHEARELPRLGHEIHGVRRRSCCPTIAAEHVRGIGVRVTLAGEGDRGRCVDRKRHRRAVILLLLDAGEDRLALAAAASAAAVDLDCALREVTGSADGVAESLWLELRVEDLLLVELYKLCEVLRPQLLADSGEDLGAQQVLNVIHTIEVRLRDLG